MDLKELNITVLAGYVDSHPNTKKILENMITYLKKDVSKLNHDEVEFILKVLRQFITKEGPQKGEVPIYSWKQIGITEIKKIKRA